MLSGQQRMDRMCLHFGIRAWGVLVVMLMTCPLFGQETLNQAVEKVTSQGHFKQAHWGALFIDLKSGEILYEKDPDKLFVPASATKLFSVACALDAFGKDFRFQTPVVRRGEINEKGELNGDLILKATGDLSFGGRSLADGKIAFVNGDHTYANGNPDAELTKPDPLAGLNDLASQVAAAGIKRVTGDVLIDDRLFDKSESSGSGPSRVTPCTINDNVIDLLLTPTEVGRLAKWESRPQTAAVQIESKLMTVEEGKPLEVTIRDLGHGRISVVGQIAQDNKPVLRVIEVPDSAAFARTLFIEALMRAGVVVDAPTLGDVSTARLPEDSSKLPQVALHASLPFSESAKLILKVSHNLHASTLPLLVASQHGERTLAAGLKRQHSFLKQAGVEVEKISFSGGAGGARGDFVTPRVTVQLLQYMYKRPDFPAYFDALPRLGVDGTLAKNISPESKARDKVRAKTGTLYTDNVMNGAGLMTSKALAGYMATENGRTLAFAIFVNNAHLRDGVTVKTFGDELGKICEIVYLNR